MKTLKLRVHPHLFRHSSATYYAQHLTHYQLCSRYGWGMSSTMPDVYIRREGIDEERVAEIIEADELGKLKKENESLNQQVTTVYSRLQAIEALMNQLVQNEIARKGMVEGIKQEKLQEKLRQIGIGGA